MSPRNRRNKKSVDGKSTVPVPQSKNPWAVSSLSPLFISHKPLCISKPASPPSDGCLTSPHHFPCYHSALHTHIRITATASHSVPLRLPFPTSLESQPEQLGEPLKTGHASPFTILQWLLSHSEYSE